MNQELTTEELERAVGREAFQKWLISYEIAPHAYWIGKVSSRFLKRFIGKFLANRITRKLNLLKRLAHEKRAIETYLSSDKTDADMKAYLDRYFLAQREYKKRVNTAKSL